MLLIGIGIGRGRGRGRGGGVIYERQSLSLRIVVGHRNCNNFVVVVVVVVVVVGEEVEKVRCRRNVLCYDSSGSTDGKRWKGGVVCSDGCCCCCCCCYCCCCQGREEDGVAAGRVVWKVRVSRILFSIRVSYKWRFELLFKLCFCESSNKKK